ncbi:MAG: hypothetical protein OEV60_08465, partial [Actinomycetota bacterium]|nr:hypothetical protein [Actinomycetota bacterium]
MMTAPGVGVDVVPTDGVDGHTQDMCPAGEPAGHMVEPVRGFAYAEAASPCSSLLISAVASPASEVC